MTTLEAVCWAGGGHLLCPGPPWASLCFFLASYLLDPEINESPKVKQWCLEEGDGPGVFAERELGSKRQAKQPH